MSNRSRNIDVSLNYQLPNGQVHVDRQMHQVMDLTVNSGVTPATPFGKFLPEASIAMPYAGSIAAITIKAYGQGVSGGSFSVMPAVPSSNGAGPQFVSGSILGTKKYPKSALPFNEKDVIQLYYSASAGYFGPSGSSAGFRIGLWVWQ